jgi:arylsulfatase A-like enzyme
VAATDRALLRLLRAMEAGGHLERTMVVATADHGVAFGEHGEFGSGTLLHDTTIRVPLVLWGPLPFRGGAVRDDLSRTIDVLPTILEAMRVATTANRPGRALQLPMKPFRERQLTAIAETFPGPERQGELRALRTATRKYVFAEGEGEALFDLVADPAEATNLVSADPREAARLSADLQKALGDDLARPKGL